MAYLNFFILVCEALHSEELFGKRYYAGVMLRFLMQVVGGNSPEGRGAFCAVMVFQ